jgi:hypothetical protein
LSKQQFGSLAGQSDLVTHTCWVQIGLQNGEVSSQHTEPAGQLPATSQRALWFPPGQKSVEPMQRAGLMKSTQHCSPTAHVPAEPHETPTVTPEPFEPSGMLDPPEHRPFAHVCPVGQLCSESHLYVPFAVGSPYEHAAVTTRIQSPRTTRS